MAKKQSKQENDVQVKYHADTFEIRQEHPELEPYLPVESFSSLNGTRPSLQDLEYLTGFFGQGFTLLDVKIWYKQNGWDFSDATFPEVVRLVESKQGGTPKEGTPVVPEENRPSCTLKQFIETRCNVIHGDAIESKVQLIYKAATAGRIKLPQKAGQWVNGRAYIFFEDDLHVLWSSYTKEIPSLFRLK